mgnify:CR=1 FL=1
MRTAPHPRTLGRTIVEKPDGGFVFIPAAAILALWQGYRHENLELLDVRVGLATFEAAMRLRFPHTRAQPEVRTDQLQCLTGATDRRRITAALRRLESHGLPASALSARRPDVRPFVALLSPDTRSVVRNHRRRVPVPRRLLVYLARCSRPAVVAVALAHLLRGLYFREGKCVAGGTCKASWVASVFGLDLRTVKAAKAELVRLGWLEPQPTPQHLLNRFGPRFLLRMNWRWVRQTPPRTGDCARQSPPPEKNWNLSLRRLGNQKRVRTGAWTAKPTFLRVQPDDLRDPSRLDALYRDAATRGLLRVSESTRLAFFAAAEHAIADGITNVPGLLVAIVRRGLWRNITQADEERARRRLTVFDFGEPERQDDSRVPDEYRANEPTDEISLDSDGTRVSMYAYRQAPGAQHGQTSTHPASDRRASASSARGNSREGPPRNGSAVGHRPCPPDRHRERPTQPIGRPAAPDCHRVPDARARPSVRIFQAGFHRSGNCERECHGVANGSPVAPFGSRAVRSAV